MANKHLSRRVTVVLSAVAIATLWCWPVPANPPPLVPPSVGALRLSQPVQWPPLNPESPIRLIRVLHVSDKSIPGQPTYELWFRGPPTNRRALAELGILAARRAAPLRPCGCQWPRPADRGEFQMRLDLNRISEIEHRISFEGDWVSELRLPFDWPTGQSRGTSIRGTGCCGQPALQIFDARIPVRTIPSIGTDKEIMVRVTLDSSFTKYERPTLGHPPTKSVLAFVAIDERGQLVRDPSLDEKSLQQLLAHDLIREEKPLSPP